MFWVMDPDVRNALSITLVSHKHHSIDLCTNNMTWQTIFGSLIQIAMSLLHYSTQYIWYWVKSVILSHHNNAKNMAV